MILALFLTFAKIGLFTFGGGYAMISLIENICVEQKKWITHDEMMDVTVIAESTPGPIAINCATYVGYRQKGIFGAIAATFGVVLPDHHFSNPWYCVLWDLACLHTIICQSSRISKAFFDPPLKPIFS